MRATALRVVAALALVATRAAAQDTSSVGGLWFGFGAGYGSGHVFCSGCAYSHGGPTALVSLGGTVRPGLRLGAEVNFWTWSVDNLWNISFTVYSDLDPSWGLFLKGGVGLASYHHHTAGAKGVNGQGLGLLGGLGYRFRVSKHITLDPVANARYGFVGQVYGDSRTQLVADIGLGVTFH
jgi:hypothetical protein